jgi:parallel beta helix pectate lyase-like protein
MKMSYTSKKKIMKILLTMLFLVISSLAFATKYYVSSSGGNDFYDGMSEASAWKTISKVNNRTFLPGDIIMFKKGDVWRETLSASSSGNVDAYISYTSYGTGIKPQILASENAGTWTNVVGNIWRSAISFTNPFAGSAGDIYFISNTNTDVTFGIPKTYTSDFSNLASEFDWTWNENVLYVYASSDPDSRYSSIEAGQRESCIYLNGKQYIEINGIDLYYAQQQGVMEKEPAGGLNGYILRNCEIAYNGTLNGYGYASRVVYSNSLFENNVIHDCGRRGISLYNYSSQSLNNIVIQNNVFYNGNHTTGIDIGAGTSGGRGSTDSIIIRNNLIYDKPGSTAFSHQIFVQNIPSSGTSVTGIYIYNNIFKYPPVASILLEGITESYIYNNTFYGHNTVSPSGTFHIWVDIGSTNATIKNNIFYSNLDFDTGGAGLEIYCLVDPSEVDADYNLYYRVADNLRIGQIGSTKYYRTISSWAAMKAATGWETHSPAPGDPKFISETNFHMQLGSPGVGCGLAIPGIESDFEGYPVCNPPCLGSFASHFSSVAPLFVCACVEDATPAEVDIIYDISLANVTPSIYAFSVKVNSISTGSRFVAIDGTKVKLELEKAVECGDLVTVSYNTPIMNPIQSASGGLADTITIQPVDNNIEDFTTYVEDEVMIPEISLFPNPAHDYLNISFDNMEYKPLLMRIIGMTGVIVFEDIIYAGMSDLKYPVNFDSGIYFVQFLSEGLNLGTVKLIVQ